MDKSSIKKICVDDFALRKRFSYGTVMVGVSPNRRFDTDKRYGGGKEVA